MSNLRRYDPEGRPVFVTCVSHNRSPILSSHADLLFLAYRDVQRQGVKVASWVILPDHVHALLELGGVDLSNTVRRFKAKFSGLYRSRYGLREGRLWQNRFWDHTIRDNEDYQRHFDYIHYNPTKHGLVNSPFEYKLSSLHWWSRRGFYDQSWGTTGIPDGEADFGE